MRLIGPAFRMALAALAFFVPNSPALDVARQSSGAAAATAKYGVTGKGVVIAILDRGIDWQHPDFRNPDGTTRIRWMLDMSGQNFCNAANPAPVEYTQQQINAALAGGTPLAERDNVGHGTLTVGIAAGNGRASNGKYTGIAPEADLIIVKMTSEDVTTPDGVHQPSFTACIADALTWLDQKITAVGEPVAGLINSGVQMWGPVDGTSAVSREIDATFGQNRPGRVYVEASGDEGGNPNHAGGSYNQAADTVVNFSKTGSDPQQLALWYTGSQPAQVSITVGQSTVGPVSPGGNAKSADGNISDCPIQPWHGILSRNFYQRRPLRFLLGQRQ